MLAHRFVRAWRAGGRPSRAFMQLHRRAWQAASPAATCRFVEVGAIASRRLAWATPCRRTSHSQVRMMLSHIFQRADVPAGLAACSVSLWSSTGDARHTWFPSVTAAWLLPRDCDAAKQLLLGQGSRHWLKWRQKGSHRSSGAARGATPHRESALRCEIAEPSGCFRSTATGTATPRRIASSIAVCAHTAVRESTPWCPLCASTSSAAWGL